MKKILLLALLTLAVTVEVRAQSSYQVMDTLFLRTENSEDPIVRCRFGFGSDYTDSIDYKGYEFELPAIPPSFYAAFIELNPDGSRQGTYMNADFRGVPDSLQNGTAKRFSLQFEFRAFRTTAVGQRLFLDFPKPLSARLDSVRIVDVPTKGQLVDTTFLPAGGSYEVLNDGVDGFDITAYYNFNISSVEGVVAENDHSDMEIAPNPVMHSSPIAVRGTMAAGTTIRVLDMLGRIVAEQNIFEPTNEVRVATNKFPAGAYLVQVERPEGPSPQTHTVVIVE